MSNGERRTIVLLWEEPDGTYTAQSLGKSIEHLQTVTGGSREEVLAALADLREPYEVILARGAKLSNEPLTPEEIEHAQQLALEYASELGDTP